MSLSLKDLGRSGRLDRQARQHATRADLMPEASLPSLHAMDGHRLVQENIRHMADGGISQNNAEHGFRAAFRDEESGRVVLARFEDGSPAPIHLLDGLPEEWVLERDEAGRISSVRPSITAGFVLNGRFFTRQEAAEATVG